jgi:hypothetical protein
MSKILLYLNLIIILFISECKKEEKPITQAPIRQKSAYSVIGDSVRLRETPNPNGKVIQVLKNATEVNIIEIANNKREFIEMKDGKNLPGYWMKVQLISNQSGWIFSPYVGLNIGGSGKGIITFIYPNNGNEFSGKVIATLTDGSVREILTPTGDLLLPKEIPSIEMHILNDLGKIVGKANSLKFSKEHNRNEAWSCSESIMVKGNLKLYEPYDNKKVLIGVLGSEIENRKGNLTLLKEILPMNKSLIISDTRNVFSKSSSYEYYRYQNQNFYCKDSENCSFTSLHWDAEDKIIISTLKAEREKKSIEENNVENPLRPISAFRIDQIENGRIKNLIFSEHFTGGDGTETEYLLAITDIDNNGILEVWTITHGWEWAYFRIYSLEKNRGILIFSGGYSGC